MMNLGELFLDPISATFMQRALYAAILVGAISGVVGTFVVVRGMSFFGDALAHAILPGVAVAYITGGGDPTSLFAGGLVAGVGSALGIGWLTRDSRLREDTATGIVFVAMFALGIAIISTDARAYGRDLVHILFGNILGIQDTDLYIMIVCGAIVVSVIIIFYKELLLISFDPGLAKTLKLPLERLRLLLLVLIAITIVASLQIVGITLMLAMLIAPSATAQLLTKRLHYMILLSSIIGVVGGIIGVYVAFHANIPTGPAIVLTVTTIFITVFIAQQSLELFIRGQDNKS